MKRSQSAARLRARLTCGTLLLGAACTSGHFAAIDQVTGLTVLAVKADPPDQLVVYDGGVLALSLFHAADAGATMPIARVTLSALVADPGGQGRGIQAVFATCAQLDPTTHQCLPQSPDYQVIGSGAYFPDGGPAIVATAAFTPGAQLLADALALDPLHGFGYLPLPVQVTAAAGADQSIGVKTLTFSQPVTVSLALDGGAADGGSTLTQFPEENPVLTGLTLDGAEWPVDAGPPAIGQAATIQPDRQPFELVYFVPEVDGGLLPFTDVWSYEFYCTAGSFSSPRSGGGPRPGFPLGFGLGRDAGSVTVNQAGEVIPSTQVTWNADAGEPSGLVYFWVVALDGRGGVDFTQRTASYQ
ncbi:MAG TPA: hypothetical protein VMB50_16925 [Myxococcales bacterium]|nr:hypothetical protein [Myxococcales bacterium]